MEIAYKHAVKKVSWPRVVSRVIVLTDGDANIGRVNGASDMLESVRGYVKEGVTLSTIGFGMGNYRDDLMEQLADKGNGNCFYIDSEREARRVFQEQLAGTLEVIAKDVKIQVEFDPATVRATGWWATRTATSPTRTSATTRWTRARSARATPSPRSTRWSSQGEGPQVATVRVRAKKPRRHGGQRADASPSPRSRLHRSLRDASANLRFAAAVAGTADILRGAPQAGEWSLSTAE